MQSTSIIRRWIRGSLLITVLVLVLAEGLFLYYSYNDLYGGVERAVENRFSTVVGRLQATGTAGDTATTAESRANVLRRVVEQFDEKDKFEFMLLDAQGVILATSSGTMTMPPPMPVPALMKASASTSMPSLWKTDTRARRIGRFVVVTLILLVIVVRGDRAKRTCFLTAVFRGFGSGLPLSTFAYTLHHPAYGEKYAHGHQSQQP